MSQRAHHHQNMEDLMTVSGQIEPPRLKPLRHPANVKPSSRQVKQSHGQLINQRHVTTRVTPVDDHRVDCWENAEQPHWAEEHGSEPPVLPGGEWRREQCDDGENPHGRYAAEVNEGPVRGTLEDVVDWGEEGGDDHDGDPGVVDSEEEEV